MNRYIEIQLVQYLLVLVPLNNLQVSVDLEFVIRKINKLPVVLVYDLTELQLAFGFELVLWEAFEHSRLRGSVPSSDRVVGLVRPFLQPS